MIRSELNFNLIQAILYYCYNQNAGAYFFNTWGADVCSLYYDNNGDLDISDWFINVAPYNIAQPSINTLLTYTVNDVQTFHNNYYVNVDSLNQKNMDAYYLATTSELNALPPARIHSGYRAFDTTLNRVVFWNGSIWQES